ncbi:hypothetical protein EQZ23_06920 [Sphingomonas sp. UV9]|uniref:hypothetical protein n=1 Tax=Sphingomonas sp. UV9 TaxID=1851410 RepID=UPI000FFB95FD|nr:hypothetical protein [Sphingomonas sp. UV9]RXD04867.1 hypothetical protein EQZ23_06920 [Sphingomonas sp. UV9]
MTKIDILGTTPLVSLARAFAAATSVPAGKSMSRDEIAVAIGARPGTGAANNRVVAARKFGLVARERGGKYFLTPLGKRLSQSPDSVELMVEAIRKVPVFEALMDRHPENLHAVKDEELVQDAMSLGATPEVAARIVRLLKSSLVFASGGEPTPSTSTENTGAAKEASISDTVDEGQVGPANEKTSTLHGTGEHDRSRTGLAGHPLIEALLSQAPAPGSDWEKDARGDWIVALDAMLALIYPPRR